ncbi:MAG TPA: hypothetical protein VMW20_02155 [Candidatus Nanoarchaeia archaeon]|nr:hypothetical protein [Candidatus Nanoarchaeia archaeon]
MTKRKVIVEVYLNDDRINSIEDLEQDDIAQYMNAKRTLDEIGN